VIADRSQPRAHALLRVAHHRFFDRHSREDSRGDRTRRSAAHEEKSHEESEVSSLRTGGRWPKEARHAAGWHCNYLSAAGTDRRRRAVMTVKIELKWRLASRPAVSSTTVRGISASPSRTWPVRLAPLTQFHCHRADQLSSQSSRKVRFKPAGGSLLKAGGGGVGAIPRDRLRN
jgi:hypothetical protein